MLPVFDYQQCFFSFSVLFLFILTLFLSSVNSVCVCVWANNNKKVETIFDNIHTIFVGNNFFTNTFKCTRIHVELHRCESSDGDNWSAFNQRMHINLLKQNR